MKPINQLWARVVINLLINWIVWEFYYLINHVHPVILSKMFSTGELLLIINLLRFSEP